MARAISPIFNAPEEPDRGITSRDLSIRFTPEGRLGPNRLGEVPGELASGGDSSNPADFVVSLPLRGIGMFGQGLGAGIKGVADVVSQSPIGQIGSIGGGAAGTAIDGFGKFLLDALSAPSSVVQDFGARLRLMQGPSGMSQDVQQMMNSGVNTDQIIKHMRETGQSFSNDKTINLGLAILLDPLNLTPFALGKVNLLKSLAKFGSMGTGLAIGGTAAGPVGAAVGAGLGYVARNLAAGTKFGKMVGEASATVPVVGGSRGLNIANKVATFNALSKAGTLAENPKAAVVEIGWGNGLNAKVPTALFAGIDRATFRHLRNVGGAIKTGMAIPLVREIARRVSPEALTDVSRLAEKIGGPDASVAVFSRFAIANVNRFVSSMSRFKTSEIGDYAASIVDTLSTDVKVAIMEYRNAGVVGTSTDYVMNALKKQAETAGKTLDEKYGLTEADITGYLQDTSTAYVGRNIDPTTGYQLVDGADTIKLTNARLEERIIQMRSDIDLQGFDAIKYATEAADHIQGRVNKFFGEEIESSARKFSEAIGESGQNAASVAGRETAASRIMLQQATQLADNIAGHASDNFARSAGSVAATTQHIAMVLDEFFGGARLVDGKAVGGKYLDNSGNLLNNPRVTQELAKRLTLSESITYGYNINRVGNIRRAFALAANYTKADGATKQSLLAEASKIMGRQITEPQMIEFAALLEKGSSFLKPTFVRSDSLVTSKVSQWTDLYDAIYSGGDINFALYDEIPQSVLADLSNLVANKAKRDDILKSWAYQASVQFADVANNLPGIKIARGLVSPEEVSGMLKSALTSRATVSRASASEIQAMKQAWAAMGGDIKQIDDVVAAAKRDGYEIGIAPESGTIQEVRVVGASRSPEGLAIPETVSRTRPFVDITADFVDGLPDFANPKKYQAGYTRKAIEFMTAPVYQSNLASQSIQRLQIGLRDRFSASEITSFYNKVLAQAAEGRVGARGLGAKSYESLMDEVLAETGDSLAARGKILQANGLKAIDLEAEVIRAMRGEAKNVGYSQAITGTLKDQGALGIGKALAKVSENYYPGFKYKYNPMFFVQELIESPFFAEARGIQKTAMEEKLRAAGLSSREIRTAFGQRSNAMRETIQEQAFFTFTARSRDGMPSALNQQIKFTDVLRPKDGGVVSGRWDKLADFKESYRDIMAIHDMAPNWQKWVMETKPDEFSSLYKTFGPDPVDQMLGWYNQYRRNSSLLFGGSAVDRLKAPGYGFAVNPSRDGLLEAQANFDGIIGSTDIVTFAGHVNQGMRPTAVGAVIRAKVINVAQDSGYDVARVRQALSNYDALAVAYAREFQRSGPNLEIIAAEYKAAQQVMKAEVNSLGKQLIAADINKAIMEELMDSAIPGFSGTENAAKVIEALANARKYGANLRPLADLIDEVRGRFAGDLVALRPGTREAIRNVVNNILAGDSSVAKSGRNVRSILTDSTQSLLRDHAGEETLFQAAKFSYMKSAEVMDRVNYFKNDRSLFERGINHQFLGLYPFSYMFGKVLPEVARFLFWKPFGAIAPGAGYSAYKKVSDYLERMGPPPEWKETTQRPDYEFLLAQLLPGTPEDITVVIPGWARRAASTVSRQGYDQYGVVDVAEEFTKPFTNTGVGGFLQLAARSAAQISDIGADAATNFFNTDEPSSLR